MLFSRLSLIYCLILFFSTVSPVFAAHYIVGVVEDALDGELADGKTVMLWNEATGMADNLTDVVGPSGASGASNVYLIDCELLGGSCAAGDLLRIAVIDGGDGYISNYSQVLVTGAGFDIAPNLTLNSPPLTAILSLDDGLSSPLGEIDLTPASTTLVSCSGVVTEFDGDTTVTAINATLYNQNSASLGSSDDNNVHYTNASCNFDTSYGGLQELSFECGFEVAYYANPGVWNCSVTAQDAFSVGGSAQNSTSVNSLLALSVPSPLDFGLVNTSEVSEEVSVAVTNAGNVMVNLSLSGYGATIGDGLAMNCSAGTANISISDAKYNLTASNSGPISLSAFESLYTNLTSSVVTRYFPIASRQNDGAPLLDDTNTTYWRMYVPAGVAGDCSGNIVFGAIRAPGF